MIYKISTPLKLCPHIFWLMMSQNYIFIHCVPWSSHSFKWISLLNYVESQSLSYKPKLK